MADLKTRANDLFLSALQIASPDDRRAFLDERCGNDPTLRKEVESRLAMEAEGGSFLQKLAANPRLILQGTDQTPANAEDHGAVIGGRYTLIEMIGEGGMGEVWVAKQSEPVKRKVALKLIKAGMDSKAVLARFEHERRALALMDHPNIAKVLDGGIVDKTHGSHSVGVGRPYFVMELVNGLPLLKFCDEAKLTPRQRLELFVPICQAVQHAHHKGIVHRDLKPTNILVTLYDGKPVPKVIDFGVAKATGGRMSDESLSTQFGAVVGTLEYMSPEQAGFSGIDIDTRADIYSLGVILYELLTGLRPFDGKRLREAALNELIRIIREEEPSKPSTRLSTDEALPSLAAVRQTEPKRLMAMLRELDWVVMKCLEKDRSRRYETANGLARDIQRFLADQPVEARPPSARYRMGKFLRRNRGTVMTASLVLLALVGGMAGTTWGLFRAEAQRGIAESNAQKAFDAAAAEKAAKETAEAQADETRAVLEFVESRIIAAARPEGYEGGLGREVTLRRAIEAALPFVEKSFTKQPHIEAHLRRTIGRSYLSLGEAQIAAEQFQRARSLYTRHLGRDDVGTLESMNDLARSYDDLGRPADALMLREEMLELTKAKFEPDHPQTLRCMQNVALSYTALGRHTDALQLREKTLALQKAKLGEDHHSTLLSMHNLADNYGHLGRHAGALMLFEETLELMKVKLGPDHLDTLQCMQNLGICYRLLGRHSEALEISERTFELRKTKLGPDHPHTLRSMDHLATDYVALDRGADALKLREETLAIKKLKHGADHPETLQSMNNLALSYDAVGRHADAVKLGEETLARRKAKLGPNHPQTLSSMHNLARVYATLGRHSDTVKLDEETYALRKASLPADHPQTLSSMNHLARGYHALGRHTDALRLREGLLASRKTKLGPDHPDTLMCMSNVAESLLKLERGAEAMPIINECLRLAEGKVVDSELISKLMDLRLRYFEKAKDVAGCRATAEMWEKLNRTDAESLYNAACMRGVTAGLLRATDKSESASNQAEAEAERAMEWLRKAVAVGYKHAEHLAKDKDFDAVRDREDFKKLLAELQSGKEKEKE